MMGDLTRLGDIILRRYEDSLSSQYPSRHACTGVDQQGDEDGVSQGWLMRLNRQSPLRIRGKSRTLPFSTRQRDFQYLSFLISFICHQPVAFLAFLVNLLCAAQSLGIRAMST